MAIISWDWTTTIWEYVGNFCGGLIRKKSDVEYAAKGMSSDEIEQANRDKARRYFNLVLLGATSILWGDITTAINKINSPTAVTAFGIYLNFVLVSIFGGAIAAVFPDLTRHYLSVSGNGVLQSFIFAILVFNIDILSSVSVSGALYELSWWVTCFVSVSAITIYWTMSTEDPMWVLVLLRLGGWILLFLLKCLCWMLLCIWWVLKGLCWMLLCIWWVLKGLCWMLTQGASLARLTQRAKLVKTQPEGNNLHLPLHN